MKNYLWPFTLPLMFLAYSLPLFLRVYAITQSVIDEEFHLRQGLHFCNKRFDVWDPKITTFPGLYLVSLVLHPFDMCSVLGLRCISLAAAALNVLLLYKIRRRTIQNGSAALAALDAYTIGALPPLYFFSHLYYTDTLSMSTVLLFYLFWLKDSHLQASVFAAASVLVRQTNIVWVGMVFGLSALDQLTVNYAASKRLRPQCIQLLSPTTLVDMLLSGRMLLRTVWQIFRKYCYYIAILLPFVAFVFLNGSIVVGDKSAHEAALHLPQIFYFSLFVSLFAVSNTLTHFLPALRWLWRHKLITAVLVALCLLTIKCNTLVHPYLLADNRHYTFYIWNRLYGRYPWFRYAMAPVYVLALTMLCLGLRHMRDSFKLMFAVATVLALCFQRLLEVRYFLAPFVLMRLHTLPAAAHRRNRLYEWLELGFYMLLNAITFYVFLHKEIKWPDFKEPQRIMW